MEPCPSSEANSCSQSKKNPRHKKFSDVSPRANYTDRESPAFYETKFTAVSTSAFQWSLYWARCIRITLFLPVCKQFCFQGFILNSSSRFCTLTSVTRRLDVRSSIHRLTLRPAYSLIQCIPGTLPLEVKRAECEAYHSYFHLAKK
jgi:hypothetical protein